MPDMVLGGQEAPQPSSLGDFYCRGRRCGRNTKETGTPYSDALNASQKTVTDFLAAALLCLSRRPAFWSWRFRPERAARRVASVLVALRSPR